jgi:hypothetical protein
MDEAKRATAMQPGDTYKLDSKGQQLKLQAMYMDAERAKRLKKGMDAYLEKTAPPPQPGTNPE